MPLTTLCLLMLSGCAIFGGGRPYQAKGEGFSEMLCNCFGEVGVKSLNNMEALDEEKSKKLMYCLEDVNEAYDAYREELTPEEKAKLEEELEKAILKSPCRSLMEEMLKY